MHPTNHRRRAGLVVLVTLLVVLAGGGQARAATAVGSGADLWYTPAQPADNAVRLTVHIADDTDVNAMPGTAERVTVYLPGRGDAPG
jgi:hypothetical protein